MLLQMSPFWIPLAVFLGGVLSPILGWARANQNAKAAGGEGESLNWKKVAASAVIAFIAAVIFFATYSAAISVGFPDLITAFIAGFGADKIVKNGVGI